MTENLLRGLSPKDELDDSSLLRTLIDSLPEHVYVKDTESRYVLNNVTHVRSLGALSLEETAAKSDFDFYPEECATGQWWNKAWRASTCSITRPKSFWSPTLR